MSRESVNWSELELKNVYNGMRNKERNVLAAGGCQLFIATRCGNVRARRCFVSDQWPTFYASQTGCSFYVRARSEPGGTRWRTGGEVKGKLTNAVGSQYSHATSELGLSSITKADAHTSAASSRLNWRPHRFEWNRPFRGKTKCGFCACAITFRTSYTHQAARNL